MKSIYYIFVVVAILAQELTALPHSSNHVSKDEQSHAEIPSSVGYYVASKKLEKLKSESSLLKMLLAEYDGEKSEMSSNKEEATVSDFGFYFTLTDLVFLFLEDYPLIASCYQKEAAKYTTIVDNYITTLKKAAQNLKHGAPKPQLKIERAMAKYPKQLEKNLLGKNYEAFEEFMWSLSSDISIWDYEIHLNIKDQKMNSSNKMSLLNYEKIFLHIRKKTEDECKKIVDRIMECMESTESNF